MTVKNLIKILSKFDQNQEIVIYPKYSAHKVTGYRKHSFNSYGVCEQEPYGIKYKGNPEACKKYFGVRRPMACEVNKHIAIIF